MNPEEDLLTIVKKMQQHLVFLEKKIDQLISQSAERPSFKKPFSRPFRRHDSPPRHHGESRGPREEHRHGGERHHGEGRRPFERPHGGERQGGGFGKKKFFKRRHP